MSRPPAPTLLPPTGVAGPVLTAGIDQELQKRFRLVLLEGGLVTMWGGRWYLSGALIEADVDRTLEGVEKAMNRLQSRRLKWVKTFLLYFP